MKQFRGFLAFVITLVALCPLRAEVFAPEDATAHVGERITIRAQVKSVAQSKLGHWYVNFGAPYPDHIFSVMIRSTHASQFTDIKSWQGREVEVQGLVTLWQEKPQIEVTTPAQIKIAEEGRAFSETATAQSATPEPIAPASAETKAGEAPAVVDAPVPTIQSTLLAGLKPGVPFPFTVPLSESDRKTASEGGNPSPADANVAVVVPPGFGPTKSWPLLIVFSTSDEDEMHIQRIAGFSGAANKSGWVVMAAEGPVKPSQQTTEWVWTMLSAGLNALHKEWPGLEKWPIACGGNSEGAEMAALMSAKLSAEGYTLKGLFLSSCSEDKLSEGMRRFDPSPRDFKKMRIWLASGTQDKVATPAMVASVKESIESKGFKEVRLESSENGHFLEASQVEKALHWFAQAE